eukprot:CAMPEP_0119266630 /NCGR_PEP_ID=MMETSP1329-20130426/5060_1 /TAXON_ID=114041 /ORGANISM="Genus nov. species nov., Strain RCC1024" /LENGTH=318 /DNA_ID=CAMNT_0007266519 /DNA_START=93 /DNA_END=1045 /DNA_ORIENTATION=+
MEASPEDQALAALLKVLALTRAPILDGATRDLSPEKARVALRAALELCGGGDPDAGLHLLARARRHFTHSSQPLLEESARALGRGGVAGVAVLKSLLGPSFAGSVVGARGARAAAKWLADAPAETPIAKPVAEFAAFCRKHDAAAIFGDVLDALVEGASAALGILARKVPLDARCGAVAVARFRARDPKNANLFLISDDALAAAGATAALWDAGPWVAAVSKAAADAGRSSRVLGAPGSMSKSAGFSNAFADAAAAKLADAAVAGAATDALERLFVLPAPPLGCLGVLVKALRDPRAPRPLLERVDAALRVLLAAHPR